MSAQPVLLLGTRPYSLALAEVVNQIDDLRVTGLVENLDPDRAGTIMGGLPIHWIGDVGPLIKTHVALCALATTHRERFTRQASAHGLRFTTAVHPTAWLAPSVTLGEGTRVDVRAVIASFSQCGRHVVVNRAATIGHHTKIGDHCTIQPGATIAGNCELGARVYVGAGATVIDGLRIGGRSVIGAGAVVIRDVPARSLVVGVPAKVIRTGIDGK